MPPSIDELIEKSIEQRSRGRFEEALVSALAAVKADNENSTAWWQLGLSREAHKDWKNAAAAYQKVVELDDNADNAWAKLGAALEKIGDASEAEEAYRTALDWNPTNEIALIGMSYIYRNRDDDSESDEELSALERLENSSVELTHLENARIGVLHYKRRQYHEAIKYWTIANNQVPDVSSIHNIGLAYNNPAISQDSDAIDMWRLALVSEPSYKPSIDMISNVLPRMLELSKCVSSANDCALKQEELFDIYINPYQLLNIDQNELDDTDPRIIQKYKKRLMQEIELEDGYLPWLEGVHIDKSKALQICDELNNADLKLYHSLVHQDEPLMSFLTKGDITHFLVGPESSIRLISDINNLPEFRQWLGSYFAPQYDRILSRALEGQNLQLIECLLDGRRWVSPAQEHECFENSRRVIDRMVQPLREIALTSENNIPSYEKINAAVEGSLLVQKFNMLPLFFEDLQNEAVTILRSLAIDCANVHGETALSEKIICLCQTFCYKSVELEQRLAKDANDIREIKEAERKHEIFLTSGDNKLHITKEAVDLNGRQIKTEDVESVRWGSTVISRNYSKEYQYTFAVGVVGVQPISFSWTATKDIESQQKHFSDIIDAALQYIMPSLLKRMEERLRNGEVIKIGQCSVTNAGVEIPVNSWFSTSMYLIPWNRCAVAIDNGQMTVRDDEFRKKKFTFGFKETANAPALLILAGSRKDQGN